MSPKPEKSTKESRRPSFSDWNLDPPPPTAGDSGTNTAPAPSTHSSAAAASSTSSAAAATSPSSGSAESPIARPAPSTNRGSRFIQSMGEMSKFPGVGNVYPRATPDGILKYDKVAKPQITSMSIDDRDYGKGSLLRGMSPVKKPEDESIGDMEDVLNRYRNALATTHYNSAEELLKKNGFVKAAKAYDDAIEIDPNYSDARRGLGSLYLRLGLLKKARECLFGPGVKLDSLESVEKHVMKCAEFRKISDWHGVLRNVDAAIGSGANASPELWACKAEATLKLHRPGDAKAAFNNISEWLPEFFSREKSEISGMLLEAYVYFVKAQIELANGSFETASSDIMKAKELDTSSLEMMPTVKKTGYVKVYHSSGYGLSISDKFREAITSYKQGLEKDPTNAVLYFNCALCWYKLGEWEKSVDDCNEALRYKPGYAKALFRRGASKFKLQKWAEAIADYEVLMKDYPDNKKVAVSLFKSEVKLRRSRGEDVSEMRFGVGVEAVYSLFQFQKAIASHGISLVHFKKESDECVKITRCLNRMFSELSYIKLIEVDISKNPDIAQLEKVEIAPSLRIYKEGAAEKELLSLSMDILLSFLKSG